RRSGAGSRDEAEPADRAGARFWQVGVNVPPLFRTKGLQGLVAAPVAEIFLRLAQMITRDQRAYNETMVAALTTLLEWDQARAEAFSREIGAARGSLE